MGRLEALLFPSTVFLGAFLLFLIEPLFAKLILPRFGGAAAVWAACLVFFQCALLLGYLYADLTSRRLTPARQAQLHIAVLLLSLLLLPIAPRFSETRYGVRAGCGATPCRAFRWRHPGAAAAGRTIAQGAAAPATVAPNAAGAAPRRG